jgi:hypothetical protein
MALQLGALRDALIDAGAKPDKADRAAEELAAYESQAANLKGDIRLVQWMAGTGIGLSLLTLGSMAALWSKVGEISGQLAQLIHPISH